MNYVRLLICALLALAAGGCQAAGAVADKVFGGAQILARYTPLKEPMLVVVERGPHAAIAPEDAERLSMLVEDQIRQNEVAPVVDSAKLLGSAENYTNMNAAQRGQALGAKQVLRVVVEKYDVTPILGGTEGVRVCARVHVVDTTTGEDRWPKTYDGTPVDASANGTSPEPLLETLAGKIAELLYTRE